MLIERENIFDDRLEKLVLTPNFPFYYQKQSTDYSFPYLNHCLILRPEIQNQSKINSEYWPLFEEVFLKFINENNLNLSQIYRASVNLTTSSNFLHNNPHVDHTFKHNVFIHYLNTFDDGHTYIFDETYDGKNAVSKEKKIIKKIIQPQKNKAICFDGKFYHAQGFCKPDQHRIVFVVTFN